MINEFQLAIQNKQNLVLDFDLTIAKIVIDWNDWHIGMAEIYKNFDPRHGYSKGKDPHSFYNQMAQRFGTPLVNEVRKFVSEYEEKNIKDYIPSKVLVKLIKETSGKNFYVYSSNSRKTVLRGLKELDLENNFKQIISRDETNYVKPIPEGFSLITGFEENIHSFIMIGDSRSDQLAAEKAKISFFKWDEFGTYRFK